MKKIFLAAAAALAFAATPAAAAPWITLYSAPDFQGHSLHLDHAVSDLDHHDWDFGDRAQSVQVHGHWQICAAKNFTGDCITLHHDVARLKDYNMNRRADSVRPY